eukprot:267364-Amphidinium_carterae.1
MQSPSYMSSEPNRSRALFSEPCDSATNSKNVAKMTVWFWARTQPVDHKRGRSIGRGVLFRQFRQFLNSPNHFYPVKVECTDLATKPNRRVHHECGSECSAVAVGVVLDANSPPFRPPHWNALSTSLLL